MRISTRRAAALCIGLLLSRCASGRVPGDEAGAPPPLTIVSIVGTNDLHGGVLPRDGRGGLSLLGGYLNNLRAARARDKGAVVLVDAGDMFQGTLESNITEGASVVAAYNVLGYTAAAIGNHEFDFGPVGPAATPRTQSDDPRGALKARAAEARFPFLAANLVDVATGDTPRWTNVRPTAVVRIADVAIGIIGLMTRDALSATISANVGGLSIAPLAETVRKHATTLRAQGVAVVIVTAHAGGRCSAFDRPEDLSSCDLSGEIFTMARDLPPGVVDVIVAGHTHAAIAHQVQGIAITEAFSGGRSFGRVDLTIDRRTNAVVGTRTFAPRDLCAREDPQTRTCAPAADPATLIAAEYEGAPVVPDGRVDAVLAPTLEQVRLLKAQPLGVFLETPVRRLAPVSPLGHLFADALLASVPGADVSLHNSSGGLRADLPQGALTYGSAYEVMPFDNLTVQVRVTGRQLRQVFATHLQQSRRILGFSGVRVRAECSRGALDVMLTRPSGAAVGDEESLLLVTSDFLATGGDGILAPIMPPGGFPVDQAAPLVRDAFIESLKRVKTPSREENLFESDRPRLSVSGTLPIRCSGA